MDTTNPNMQVAEEASSLSLTTPISNTIAEERDLDAFITQARVNALEGMNKKLLTKLDIEQNEGLDNKEAYGEKIKKLNTELDELELLYHKNEKALKKAKKSLEATINELDATKKHLELTTKGLKATSRDLEATSRDLETTKRELYATSRELEEEKLLHKESRKALNEEKYKVYQNEQEIRQLHLNIAKLKETFMESVSELRGGVMPPHSMVGMYQPQFPNREYPSRMDLNYEEHRSKRKAINEPEFKEHPSKYKAMGGDLREIMQSKKVPKPERYKRICHYGNLCRYPICDYAHSIEDLIVCRQGLDCIAKSYCGYMIHSEEDRKQLSRFVESRGINIVLCKEYEKYKKCPNGEKCNKIHHNSH